MLALLLAIGMAPTEGIVKHDRIDVLELNHYYDDTGNHVLSQFIGWDWTGDGHHVAWWFIDRQQARPYRVRGDFVLTIGDGDKLRHIRARSFRESWTQYDPEVADRDAYPERRRRGLAK